MRPISLLCALATVATASGISNLNKRCTPTPDRELALGYMPVVGCWQDQDTACRPYIKEGTELVVDEKHKLAIVYGIDQYCMNQITEELAREKDGRKNNGWLKKHGQLNLIGNGILVISMMSEESVKQYQNLKYRKNVPLFMKN
jgi:hypothetical protein